jgi:hypothetical protein
MRRIRTGAEKVVKHKVVNTPWECSRCGYCWYGGTSGYGSPYEHVRICHKCYLEMDNYAYGGRNRPTFYEQLALIAKSPHTGPRSYDKSVPAWMRQAIEIGMVKTAQHDLNIRIWARGKVPVKLEYLDKRLPKKKSVSR